MQRPERVLTLGVAVAFSPWVEGLWPAGGRAPDAAARGDQPGDPGDHQQHDARSAGSRGCWRRCARGRRRRRRSRRRTADKSRPAPARAAAGQNLTRTPTTRLERPLVRAGLEGGHGGADRDVVEDRREHAEARWRRRPSPTSPRAAASAAGGPSSTTAARRDLPEVERRERGGERPVAAGRRTPRTGARPNARPGAAGDEEGEQRRRPEEHKWGYACGSASDV